MTSYKLEKVNDFLNIPEDRIEDCLKEFYNYLQLLYLMKKDKDLTNVVKFPENFIWNDDGEENINVKLTISKKED